MNAKDYFDLAQKLAQMRTEAAIRSAISRGYYAAFHFGKNLVEALGFNLPKDAAAHDELYRLLNNSGIKSAEEAADWLRRLRQRRTLADYDFTRSDLHSHFDCQKDLLRVASIIAFCESYSVEPLRATLKKGLADYIQKIGS
ncbi:MAG: HEPN domain-containing protein [candidate division KSB1 bacterium]|nr:HEPN domain-containing protein [candidate division KSB1 bacterium]MDZ7301648.1 HEPN domain-containing protein [candidate division KSB1 bacterium]MDZ7313491.1 HEPN domain-containing protein [candidate division KSB1 bacterium]